MQIRAAETEDRDDIARMWHLGWHQAHAAIVDPDLVDLRDPAEFAARTQAHLPQTRVAIAPDGALAGFFMVEGDELYQFYVASARHGDGTARTLMTAAEAAFEVPCAWLACTVGNARAAAFYAKCGWRNCGAEPCAVETGAGPRTVEVWRFEKTL
ncbi:GNAT family N-acetyltransferase [uncultured Sulfitobacter sp.]|uniref:GNAT family N-acetyltransferase n=1 Tax=uncultured Sulfitobacter sp. TaxID=191468 RepID=UPI0026347451|nr:GNAT family N-acetyltransferase [uncultured Sulfitobacter sp.]